MTKRIVSVGDVACGSEDLFLIAGPCVIEDDTTMLRAAEGLAEASQRLGIPVIFKSSFRSEERRVGKECRSRWSPYH